MRALTDRSITGRLYSNLVDLLRVGVVLLNAEGEVLAVNHAADLCLSKCDGLGIADGRLCACCPDDQRALAQALDGLNGGQSRATVTVQRSNGFYDYQLVLHALERRSPADGEATTAVFLSDPTVAGMQTDALLRDLYGLSASEAEVSAALAQGYDIGQIALRRGVGRETVRTLIKRAFDKTGTRRQLDLVRVVLACSSSLPEEEAL